MNEAYDPRGNAASALLSLRLLAGKGETQGVLGLYEDAAVAHGASRADCASANRRGQQDRAEAEAASKTTLLTTEEILADMHASLVAGSRASAVTGKTGLARGVRYLVCNENTLCYQQPGNWMLGILAGSVVKGGHSWREGIFMPLLGDQLRDASMDDFERFRVRPEGHLI